MMDLCPPSDPRRTDAKVERIGVHIALMCSYQDHENTADSSEVGLLHLATPTLEAARAMDCISNSDSEIPRAHRIHSDDSTISQRDCAA